MHFLSPLLLGLVLVPSVDVDPAHLRELLLDRQDPRQQGQAALLLVQYHSAAADTIIRQGLRQTESPEIFQALITAVRLCRDQRFNEELLAALSSTRPGVRQTVAQTLATVGPASIIPELGRKLQDSRTDPGLRQTIVWILGRSGRKEAVPLLLQQLESNEEAMQRAAYDALADLSGLTFGLTRHQWQTWWQTQKDLTQERWQDQRLAYQISRAQRLEGDLERTRSQVVLLHQQLYRRLPVADRPAHIHSIVDHEDPAVRQLAVQWSIDLLTTVTDDMTRDALSEVLLRLSLDSHTDVQRQAVLGLARVEEPAAFLRLRSLLRKGVAPVRAAAARSLAQQARGTDAQAEARRKDVVPLLQKALNDPALEVVVEVAEDLGALGVPEAGPILVGLLKHSSDSVRQTAVQALERVADATVLEGLLRALDDASATIRFSLIGALGHAAGDAGRCLSDTHRDELRQRLVRVLEKDADPGVRSRAATVLGECGEVGDLHPLWQRVQAIEDRRVQDKAWAAFLDLMARLQSLDALRQWDANLTTARQGTRRIQLLMEINNRWQKRQLGPMLLLPVREMLVEAQLDQGKWSGAIPLVREMLTRGNCDADTTNRQLRWLLKAAQQALKEGQTEESQRLLREGRTYLPRQSPLAEEFDRLESQIRLMP